MGACGERRLAVAVGEWVTVACADEGYGSLEPHAFREQAVRVRGPTRRGRREKMMGDSISNVSKP